MAYHRNYPVLSYRYDDVDDVPNCFFDSYTDFLGRAQLFKKNCISFLVINIRSCHSNFGYLIIFLKGIYHEF